MCNNHSLSRLITIVTIAISSLTSLAVSAQAPQLISSIPSNDATEVAIDSDIVLTFNKPVDISASKFITAAEVDNIPISNVSGSITINGNTVTIDPRFSDNFPKGKECSITFNDDVFKDSNGVFLPKSSWNFTTAFSPPITQARNLTFTDVTPTSMTVTWSNGSGANRIVVASEGANLVGVPAALTTYTASAAYRTPGTQLGNGFVVYSGPESTVTITGLNPNSFYHFQVFEYNGTSGTEQYNVNPAADNPNNQATLSPFIVTNTEDSGTGSLRWCMENANASSGGETITFNIPTASPWVISPATRLPQITETTTINASTQPGWTPTNLVQINNANSWGLYINANDCEIYGLHITRTGTSIWIDEAVVGGVIGSTGKGNVLSGNDQYGILNFGSHVIIQGNKIGTDVMGTSADPNRIGGIRLSNSSNNTIGGNGQGNLISGNTAGIEVFSESSLNIIQGNWIGLDATGITALGNSSSGIRIGWFSEASNNTIGGLGTGEGNVIAANGSDGSSGSNITLGFGSNNVIRGNSIGVDVNGNIVPNTVLISTGVELSRKGTNPVLNDNTIDHNIIAGQRYGVRIDPSSGTGTANGNTIRQNQIYCNEEGILLTDNANDAIVAPTLTGYTSGTGTATVTGNCPDCETGDQIDVYRDNTTCSPAQGVEHLGTVVFSMGDNPSWVLSGITLVNGDRVSATVTNAGGSTSEFSPNSPEIAIYSGIDTSGDLLVDDMSSVNGGSALFGNDVTVSFTIANIGLDYLNISSITGDGINFTFANVPSLVGIGSTQTFEARLIDKPTGVYFVTITISSNDADEGVYTFRLQAEITAPKIEVTWNSMVLTSPSSINFGSGVIGTDLSQTVTVKNTGTSDLTVSGYTLSDDTKFSTFATGTTIPADGEISISVVMGGRVLGMFTDQLTIISDDADEDSFTINLNGMITATPEPEIEVLSGATSLTSGAASIDFGSAIQNNDLTQTITISNTGMADLTITGYSFTDGEKFSTLPTGTTIPADGEISISIVMGGRVLGMFTDQLTIISDDADESSFLINLNGMITATPEPDIEVHSNSSPITELVELLPSQQDDVVTHTFEILNNGTANLNVSDITSSNTAYMITNITLPNTIGVGGVSTFDLALSTIDLGVFETTIAITSDDPDQGNLTFDVRAIVEGAQVVIVITNPDNSLDRVIITNQDIDIGQTALNVNIEKVFGIENLSTSEVIAVNSITVDNAVFEVMDFTSTVPAGDFIEFTIVLRANDIGRYSSNVTVSTSINNFSFRVIGEVTSEVTSEGNPDLNIYNVVSPNGDNVHDFFKIGNITAYPDNQVIIYNRWGDKVFEAKGYDNDTSVFFGVSNVRSNKELNEGNYYYAIDKGNGSKKETGYLFIKR